MGRDVVGRNGLSFFIAQVGIGLRFDHYFGKISVGLGHRNYRGEIFVSNSLVGKCGYLSRLSPASAEDPHKAVLTRTVGGNYIRKNVAFFPRADGVFSDLVKPRKPRPAIYRRVFHQGESRGGHIVGDVADVPLTAEPDRAEIR